MSDTLGGPVVPSRWGRVLTVNRRFGKLGRGSAAGVGVRAANGCSTTCSDYKRVHRLRTTAVQSNRPQPVEKWTAAEVVAVVGLMLAFSEIVCVSDAVQPPCETWSVAVAVIVPDLSTLPKNVPVRPKQVAVIVCTGRPRARGAFARTDDSQGPRSPSCSCTRPWVGRFPSRSPRRRAC
jgi:hypothetical protein